MTLTTAAAICAYAIDSTHYFVSVKKNSVIIELLLNNDPSTSYPIKTSDFVGIVELRTATLNIGKNTLFVDGVEVTSFSYEPGASQVLNFIASPIYSIGQPSLQSNAEAVASLPVPLSETVTAVKEPIADDPVEAVTPSETTPETTPLDAATIPTVADESVTAPAEEPAVASADIAPVETPVVTPVTVVDSNDVVPAVPTDPADPAVPANASDASTVTIPVITPSVPPSAPKKLPIVNDQNGYSFSIDSNQTGIFNFILYDVQYNVVDYFQLSDCNYPQSSPYVRQPPLQNPNPLLYGVYTLVVIDPAHQLAVARGNYSATQLLFSTPVIDTAQIKSGIDVSSNFTFSFLPSCVGETYVVSASVIDANGNSSAIDFGSGPSSSTSTSPPLYIFRRLGVSTPQNAIQNYTPVNNLSLLCTSASVPLQATFNISSYSPGSTIAVQVAQSFNYHITTVSFYISLHVLKVLPLNPKFGSTVLY